MSSVSISDDESLDQRRTGCPGARRAPTVATGPGEQSADAATLLILDNCEHVAGASAMLVARLVKAHPSASDPCDEP